MNYEFKLPDIGEGLTEGEVVKWHVKVGDVVKENQPLCSVLTDKAEVEIPSPKSGKIAKLFAKPGEKVKVHAPLVEFELGAGASGNGHKEPEEKPAVETKKHAEPKKEAPPKKGPAPAASSGTYEFKLPDIGEGLTEGEVVKWHVKVGDSIKENQPLCSVLTDKAEVEIPSPKSGTIAKLYAQAGDKVKVHAPLVAFNLSGGGAAAKAEPAQDADETVETHRASPARSSKPALEPATTQKAPSKQDVLATPMVRQLAKSLGVALEQVHGSGPQGRVLEADVKNFKGGGASAPSGKANATPAVIKLAAELGVDLSRVQGTGPGGRIAEWDVRKLAPARTPAQPPARRAGDVPRGPVSISPASNASTGEERVPFVGIRRKIAERLHQSVQTCVHVTHMDECDMTALVALRSQLKSEAEKKGVKLTYLPFIIRALLKTLKEFPSFNSSLNDAQGELVIKRYYNIGIAVNAGQGLVVPNIKGADGKDLWGLAADVQSLAEKVRANKIDVPSLQGGTFTITNIGPIGGLFATPIINYPEVAILGLMELKKRPIVDEEGGLVVRDMMNLVLSFDHRVVDGADAASFMNTLIKFLENPRTIL